MGNVQNNAYFCQARTSTSTFDLHYFLNIAKYVYCPYFLISPNMCTAPIQSLQWYSLMQGSAYIPNAV